MCAPILLESHLILAPENPQVATPDAPSRKRCSFHAPYCLASLRSQDSGGCQGGTHLSLAPGSLAVTAAHCRLKAQGKWLKASLAHACVADCSLCVVVDFFASLSAEPLHGWQRLVSHGSPFRLDQSDPRPTPAVRAVAPSQGAQSTRRTAGSFRCTKGAPQVGSKPRINHDVAREMAQTKVSRLEKAVEADGREARTSRGGPQSRLDESQDSFEETVGERRNKQVPQVHHKGGEAHQGVGH